MAGVVRALLFSDIEGSTQLLASAGPGYTALLDHHRRLVRAEVAAAGGTEHGTEGDSFFVSFPDPTSALAAAVGTQRRMSSADWPAGHDVRVRIGIHLGEVEEHDGSLVGLAVHHAARIAACAHGGQVVLTDHARRLVSATPPRVSLDRLGEHRLRDVGPVVLHQATDLDRPAPFPPLRAPLSLSLPAPATSFVDGSPIIAETSHALDLASVVTLTGAGGVGKTRAALEVARRTFARYDAVHFVDLAPLADAVAVSSSIVTALGIALSGRRSPLDATVSWIGDRSVLLVLDNCEHLIVEVADVVARIACSCPNARVLSTSREPLGVAGERIVRVPSLDVDAAVELFSQRARSVDASFDVADDLAAVREVCIRLDGIPLAIELAAARMTGLSPGELLARLHDRFRLLRGRGRGGNDRHQTLRATVSWSYDLLSPDEQLLFDRLSVFASGCYLDGAEAVCGFGPLDRADVIDHLHALVDKSMVVGERTHLGTRYRLLETMRQFGEERLEQRGDTVVLRDRHLTYLVDRAERLDRGTRGCDEILHRRLMEADWDNFRAAHSWSITSGAVGESGRLAAALFQSATRQMHHDFGAVLDDTDEVERSSGGRRAQTVALRSYWSSLIGEELEARRLALEAIDTARTVGEEHAPYMATAWGYLCAASPLVDASSAEAHEAFAHMQRCVTNMSDPEHDWSLLVQIMDAALNLGDDEITPYLQQATEIAQRVRAPSLDAYLLTFEGNRLVGRNHAASFAAASECFTRALDITVAAGNRIDAARLMRGIALAQTGLASEHALRACRDALASTHEIHLWQKTWQVLDDAALSLARAGDIDAAATVLRYLDEHIPAYGMESMCGFRDLTAAIVRSSGTSAAARQGRIDLTPEALVALVLERLDLALRVSGG